MNPSLTRALLAWISFLPPAAQGQEPVRFDFEGDAPASVPSGWFVPPAVAGGYGAEVVAEGAHAGQRCARIFLQDEDAQAPFGNMMRSFDAAPYRGKRVGLTVAIRSGDGAQAQAWMRVDRRDGAVGFFDNMGDRPIRDADWSVYAITGGVHADAEFINFGVMLVEGEEVFVDGVTFEVLGDLPEPAPPRPLAERGLANVTLRSVGFANSTAPSAFVRATRAAI